MLLRLPLALPHPGIGDSEPCLAADDGPAAVGVVAPASSESDSSTPSSMGDGWATGRLFGLCLLLPLFRCDLAGRLILLAEGTDGGGDLQAGLTCRASVLGI